MKRTVCGAEGVNIYTARLFAGGNKNIVNRLADGRFISGARVKAPEDVEFHATSLSSE